MRLSFQKKAQKKAPKSPEEIFSQFAKNSRRFSNTRRGGFPTPRTQFINNGFGLGEFLDKRGLIIRPDIFAMRFYIDIIISL